MTVRVDHITLNNHHAGADVFTGDDTYAIINGGLFRVFNDRSRGLADQGFPVETGDGADVTTFDGKFFAAVNVPTSFTLSLFDRDGAAFDDLLAAPDDFLGSATYFVTGSETGTKFFKTEVFQGGSDYEIGFNVTALSKSTTSGKIADSNGGVMQGSNTAGTLIGKNGKDIIFGNNGDDIIVGGGNNDVLNGGNGDDVTFGGKGNDTLSGGTGHNIFVIAPNNGFDLIKDFHKGDLLGLDKSLQFKDLTILNQAKGTLVKAGNEKLAFLQGVHQLSVGDFTQIDLNNLNSRVQNDFAALSKT